ncbi:hypothetical protein T4B_6087 [Trichinella pseudospiralis]|uniref:Uncharacterized protein n=1 Tax=Trichinella pseudospiralis TaxID=6337 RepID=A0A0V1KCQ7_TRIPS|nr:hypothetical protein T4B_6087 [Trichinella pseudospiralis]KRZ45035.1 hypothetical protein T4C_810 [Trichinella pseudospiralis]
MANRHRWYYVVEDILLKSLAAAGGRGGDQRAGRRGNGDWMMNGTDKPERMENAHEEEIAGGKTKKKGAPGSSSVRALFTKSSNGSTEARVDELTNGQVEHRRLGHKKKKFTIILTN